MGEREEQIANFLEAAGWAGSGATKMSGDLSPRKYTRLKKRDGSRAVLMDADPKVMRSTPSYIAMTEWLQDVGLSAPKIIAAVENSGLILLEDFGDEKLTKLIQRDPTRQVEYYQLAVDALLIVQESSPPDLPHPTAKILIDDTKLADAWYPGANSSLLAQLKTVLEPLLSELLAETAVVSLRDFHTDNVMWLEKRRGVKKLGLLDFQDAILTHPAYDLMSLLTDARVSVARFLRKEMIEYFAAKTQMSASDVSRAVAILGTQRNLRILGIFARAARKFGNTQHLDAIPLVYGYLSECLSHPSLSGQIADLRSLLPTPNSAFLDRLRA